MDSDLWIWIYDHFVCFLVSFALFGFRILHVHVVFVFSFLALSYIGSLPLVIYLSACPHLV